MHLLRDSCGTDNDLRREPYRSRNAAVPVLIWRSDHVPTRLQSEASNNTGAKHPSSSTGDSSVPGALVAALGVLECLWCLALLAATCNTALGAGPVVEGAAVLNLAGLALDW
jgi:hypothetical protein